jgi:hypothetical protein
LAIELAALRWRIRTEHEELAIAAAKRARIGAGAPELGALALDRALRAARPVMGGDGLLQPRALARVLGQRTAAENGD